MPVSAQTSPVDLAHLARYTGGDMAINAEVLNLFATQSAELLTKLHSVLQSRDLKSWKEITHSLKGAARGIGAFGYADAAADAEPLAPAPDDANALRALATLQSEAQAVQLFIDAYLGR
jgi:HPt (histidine-containing phosphotransfer) domain-containing protein